MSWLDDLLGPMEVQSAGTALSQRAALNFGSGLAAVDNPANDRIDITAPAASGSAGGIVPAVGVTGSVVQTSDGATASWAKIVNANVAAGAAIDVAKLARGAANEVVKTDAGATTIESGLLVNANVAAAAAIAGTKVDPDFGAQDIVTTGYASIGGTPAGQGTVRLPEDGSAIFRNKDGDGDVAGFWMQSTTNYFFLGGATGTAARPARIYQDAGTHIIASVAGTPKFQLTAGNVNFNPTTNSSFQVGGTTRLDVAAAVVELTVNDLRFDSTVTPTLSQATLASGTGATMTVHSQDVTTGTGGDFVTRPGSGSVASGAWYAKDGAANNRITIDASGDVHVDAATNATIEGTSGVLCNIGGNLRLTVADTYIEANTTIFRFDKALASATVQQETSTTDDDTGAAFTENAQDVSAGGTAIVGGAFLSRGGDAAGAATSKTGGNWTARPGAGATANGTLALQDGSANSWLTIDTTLELKDGASGTKRVEVDGTGLGFFGSAPIAKPTVNGAKGGNAALTSLCTQLSNLGLINDTTT